MNISNISEIANASTNLTGNVGELYTEVQLVFFFVFTLPTIVLSVVTIIAIVLAKDVDWNMRIILCNVFASKIINSFGLSMIFLGQPIRRLFGIGSLKISLYLCGVTITFLVTGNGTNIGIITFYSILVYVFLRNNIKKVKWYMVAIPVTIIWVVSLLFGLVIFIFIQRNPAEVFVYKGFCPNDLTPMGEIKATQALGQLGVGWLLEGFLCGTIIAVFSILTYRYMKKSSLTGDDRIKRAIGKNLLFLSGGAFWSISNAVLYPTILNLIPVLRADETVDIEDRITTLLITAHVIDIMRSLSAIYTPVVTILLLKPVRDAIKVFFQKCRVCKQE